MAANFNSSGDYLQASSVLNNSTNRAMVSLFCKPAALGVTGYAWGATHITGGGGRHVLRVGRTAGDAWYVLLDKPPNATARYEGIGGTVTTGWHHLLLWFASLTVRLYVDGALVISGGPSFSSANLFTSIMNVGDTKDRLDNLQAVFGGDVAEVAIWNQSDLSTVDPAESAAALAGGACPLTMSLTPASYVPLRENFYDPQLSAAWADAGTVTFADHPPYSFCDAVASRRRRMEMMGII